MRIVFLDLDGTLTDPKPGITRSIRHALHALGHAAPAEEASEAAADGPTEGDDPGAAGEPGEKA